MTESERASPSAGLGRRPAPDDDAASPPASAPPASAPPALTVQLAERPRIPDYGVPETDDGLLPWSWADERLRDAVTYWISTRRPDGRPHAAPVWAVWLDGRLWFEGGLGTRRARNLAADPRAVASIHVDDATAVIVEGVVEVRTDPDEDLAARLLDAYGKYRVEPWRYEADAGNWRSGSGGALWALRPRKVLGWSRFPADATRWRFEEPAAEEPAAEEAEPKGGDPGAGPSRPDGTAIRSVR